MLYRRDRRFHSTPNQCRRKSDGCPTFAKAYSGFPVDPDGVDEPHAAFLNESRTSGCWWRPVQEIRIRGPKKMGAARRSLLLDCGKCQSFLRDWSCWERTPGASCWTTFSRPFGVGVI